LKCLAKTLYGLEDVLAEELSTMGMQNVRTLNRAVSFTTNWYGLYQSNVACRTALAILVEVATFPCHSEEQLYQSIKNIDWEDFLTIDQKFMVRATLNHSTIQHSQYAALKVKDAIVDQFREKIGSRPDVDTRDADLHIGVHISNNKCTLSLDSSGQSLFKRGYRKQTGIAPINECLAAGIIDLIGFKGERDFYDPMCGSGTFLIEAAIKAHNAPSGMRREFGFQNWMNYDKSLFAKVIDKEANSVTDIQCKISGADLDREVLNAARANITSAFMEDSIVVGKKDFFNSEVNLKENTLVVFNPPYDKRLSQVDVHDYYSRIGDTLKRNYKGCEVWIISAHLDALKHVGLKASKKIKLFNGPLEARLQQYFLYSGSRKSK